MLNEKRLAELSETLDDFLRGLADVGRIRSVCRRRSGPRVTQLFNKTNQFNPTTRRYTARGSGEFRRHRGNITLQFRLLDKFGDNGLVSAMILRPDPQRPGGVLEIDNWVMSCRVFGRRT